MQIDICGYTYIEEGYKSLKTKRGGKEKWKNGIDGKREKRKQEEREEDGKEKKWFKSLFFVPVSPLTREKTIRGVWV